MLTALHALGMPILSPDAQVQANNAGDPGSSGADLRTDFLPDPATTQAIDQLIDLRSAVGLEDIEQASAGEPLIEIRHAAFNAPEFAGADGDAMGAGASRLFGSSESTPARQAFARLDVENEAIARRIDMRLNPVDRGEDDTRVDLRWLLPADVVRFLRENREWMLVGVASALILLWIGSAAVARRQR
jgi:hypothetical protein